MIEEEKQRLLKIALKMDVFRKKVSIIQKSFLCSHKITIKKLRGAVDEEMVKRLKYTYRNYYAIIYHCSSLQQIARNGCFHYLSLKEYFTEVPLL